MTVTERPPRRSGERIDRIAELEEERRFLLRSLKDLEREHDAGDVDDDDHATLRDGYTVRAATVLRQIDDGKRQLAPKKPRRWGFIAAVTAAAILTAGGIGLVLANAFGERGQNQEITGFTPGDSIRSTLASARAAMNAGQFEQANELFIDADRRERERGNENAEARTYLGWTFALLVRSDSESVATDERLEPALLALTQAIDIDPTYADPYCFVAIIEYNFRNDADAALPFVEECESRNPPADVENLIVSFADEIRAAAG